MRIFLAAITDRKRVGGPMGALVEEYLGRSKRYGEVEYRPVASEARLMELATPGREKSASRLLLADSCGTAFTSRDFAGVLEKAQQGGVRICVLAIGPPNGWSENTLAKADAIISFGRITLPHELATVVLAEQVYRALTILAGHPYHCGH